MGVKFGRMGHSRFVDQRKKRLLVFGGSTLALSLIVIITSLTIHSQLVQASKDVVVEPPMNNEIALGTVVLIAANTRIPKGTKITPAYLREVHWPRDQVPEGAVRNMQDIENMFALATLPENQPILRSGLVSQAPNFSIGELLPPGHRAVSVQVNSVSAVEGWATPGAHVDVYLTYLDTKDGVNKTRIAVENAVVLSFGGSTKAPEGDEDTSERGTGGINATTVTLAVPVADALKIQTAVSVGRITLALRNPGDVVSAGAQDVFGSDQWDQHRFQKREEKKASHSKGYAKITDSGGNERQFVLGSDDQWQTDLADDSY